MQEARRSEMDPARIGIEVQAVSQRFSRYQFRATPDGLLLLNLDLRTITGTVYRVTAVYPSDYPLSPPRVYPVPALQGPHLYKDGAMCLSGPDDRVWTSRSTAVTVLSIAARWLHAHECWEKTGHWPGEEHK